MFRRLFLSLLVLTALSACTGRPQSRSVRKKVILTAAEKEEQRLLVRELEVHYPLPAVTSRSRRGADGEAGPSSPPRLLVMQSTDC